MQKEELKMLADSIAERVFERVNYRHLPGVRAYDIIVRGEYDPCADSKDDLVRRMAHFATMESRNSRDITFCFHVNADDRGKFPTTVSQTITCIRDTVSSRCNKPLRFAAASNSPAGNHESLTDVVESLNMDLMIAPTMAALEEGGWEGLDRLPSELKRRTTIRLRLERSSLGRMADCAKRIANMGFLKLDLQPYRKEIGDFDQETKALYRSAMEEMASLHGTQPAGPEPFVFVPIERARQPDSLREVFWTCEAGRTRLCIDWDGRLYPCGWFPELLGDQAAEFSLGSVQEGFRVRFRQQFCIPEVHFVAGTGCRGCAIDRTCSRPCLCDYLTKEEDRPVWRLPEEFCEQKRLDNDIFGGIESPAERSSCPSGESA